MGPDGVRDLVGKSVTNYVNARLQDELASRIERGSVTEQQATDLMSDIRGYVASVVRLDLSHIDVLALDWKGAQGRQVVEDIYKLGYTLLGEN